MGVDISGVDILGVDILRVDILGVCTSLKSSCDSTTDSEFLLMVVQI